MIYFLLVFMLCCVLLLAITFDDSRFKDSHLLAKNAFVTNQALVLNNRLNRFFVNRFPVFVYVINGKFISRIFFPLLSLFSFFALFLNPKITNFNFGLILAILMSFTYTARIYYHNLDSFRTKFLLQIKQLFFNIRNHLSNGFSLDLAILENLSVKYKEPVKKEIANFIKLSQVNIIENFPKWLIRLEDFYKIAGLKKVSQILMLELKYNNNQEQAFEKAIESISQRIEQNSRQKNNVLITLTTIDFMTLMFLGVVFFVLPNLSSTVNEWWLSFRRELICFISAVVLWTMYLISLLFLIRRVA